MSTATDTSARATVTAPPQGAAALTGPLATRFSPRAFDAEAELGAAELGLLLEAARWAPSASNTQPARFLVGRRGDRAFAALLAALMPMNQAWARDASALVLVAAETAVDGAPRHWAVYDAGQAAAHLTVQAAAMGLAVRQMGGFVPAALPALPADVAPFAVLAVGTALPADRIPADHPAHRLPARSRRPVDELLLDVASDAA